MAAAVDASSGKKEASSGSVIENLLLGDIELHVKKGEWKSLLMWIYNPLFIKLDKTVQDAVKASVDKAAEKAIDYHIEKLKGDYPNRKFHLEELRKMQDCKSEWLSDEARNKVGKRLADNRIDLRCEQSLPEIIFIGKFRPPIKGKHFGSLTGVKNTAKEKKQNVLTH